MKVLLVAATAGEMQGVQEELAKSSLKADMLVTGVGMTATAYALGKRLTGPRVDMVVNIGLAGSFLDEIRTGEVVQVVSESFGDLGAEDDRKFITACEAGLQKEDEYPFWNGKLLNHGNVSFSSLQALKKVKAITVNTVHGNQESIE